MSFFHKAVCAVTGTLGLYMLPSDLLAQKETSLCEVTVRGIRPERFMVGQKVQEIDSATLARNRFSTMTEFLQFQAPVAFRSYGAGQVASISMRGTAASHTAVLWNGVNINFPSLGQTDFSTIPVASFDQMTIQYGSAASCVGTDAVGGSIQLRSVPQLTTRGLQGIAGARLESAQNYALQAGIKWNSNLGEKWKLATKTLLYGSIFNNNFGTAPISDRRGRTYNVEPIQTTQKGWVQDVYFQHHKGDLIALNLWFTDNNLTIQPDRIDLREITRTQAYRILGSYQWGKTLIRTGFIRDVTDYGRAENTDPSHTRIDRLLTRIEHDFSWIKNCEKGTNLKIGAEVVHFAAMVDGYGSTLKTENRLDLYALLRHQFSGRLSGSLNLRQAFVTRYHPPFTPSLGVEYVVYRQKNTKISLPANVALSYRVPTLNERFWVRLGNPDIKPETGFNKEMSIVWQQRLSTSTQTKLSLTAFHNLIDNWTYWNPDRNYFVENLQQVLSKGIEIEAQVLTKTQGFDLNATVQYALTNASQQKEFGAFTRDILGKQLIYVPRHVVSSTISATRKSLSLSVQQQFNSARFITFDHTGLPFPPYYVMNVLLNYQTKFKKSQLDIVLQGNNLTNTLYPNLKKNAMPMRSVALNLVYHFQNQKSIQQ